MRLRTVAAIAAAMGFVRPAFAEVRLTAAVIPRDRRGAEIRVIDHSVILEIAGPSEHPSEVTMPLAIADGMHVAKMAVAIGRTRIEAVRTTPWLATVRFRTSLLWQLDPALLEQTAPGVLVLHVFPVTSIEHAYVELTVEPDHPASDWMHVDPHPGVDETVSLVALERPRSGPVPAPVFGDSGYHGARSIDHKMIRRYVRLQEPRLANCWQHELFHAPVVEGTAELHFTITPSGAVADVSVDGSLDSAAAKRCMAEDIATWQLPASDGATRVNYPLTFHVATP